MRSSRFIVILVALMFAAMAPLSSAQATNDGVYAKARTAHVIEHLQAGKVSGTGRFFVKGQVVTYPNKFVKLHKQKCKNCKWRPLKQRKTSNAGSFRMELDGPRGSCYRRYVPGTAKYRPAYRKIGCIVAAGRVA